MKRTIIFFSWVVPLFLMGEEVLFLQPNTTQIFTELYQVYGLAHPPQRTFFENGLYLDQSVPPEVLPLQPSNQVIFDHASEVLREFHKRNNDLELYIDPEKPKPFFYTAVGSKHLLVALVYAIAMTEPEKKFLFIEEIPYYSGHPNALKIFSYPNARFVGFHDPAEVQPNEGEVVVEFVTSPNNPDGKFRKPHPLTQVIIGDFVFASSAFGSDGWGYNEKNIEWVREARKSGKTVFSLNSASKQFGKTGTRVGYIWYPMHDTYAASIFKKFFQFISYSTVSGGSSGLAEFLNLIKAFLDMPDNGRALRQDANKSLAERHKLVEKEILKRYPGSTITSIPGSPTFFAKIKDERIPAKKASDVLLEDIKFYVNHGELMGESNEYVRLNLSGYSEILVDFLNRLRGEKVYTAQDLLVTSASVCKKTKVVANYAVNPGDCRLEVDAFEGPITITLSPFMDYITGPLLTIKKVDGSPHAVLVESNEFKHTLNKRDEIVQVQWEQPDYLNGQWSKK